VAAIAAKSAGEYPRRFVCKQSGLSLLGKQLISAAGIDLRLLA
jgi:hypothetical protein